ncbi:MULTISPECIES: helix-turn-helix transcriptional regulator [Fructobacillus]|uniref:helix-turn-helix transcriptional regulator n=1 Tax=Fructobacillus TaxID=559173 RepID=UPI00064D7648|nr:MULTISPECIES: helix-turn-helix transcriptional regulator [Fructobacillus]KMK53680.1 HTH-type transcriptional regulator SinR [Fructobacillus sp. EFB-N1]MCK8627051.1 helix-turn-helix domain-containing protein [Fructobacillus cardui]GIC69426.1 helix-turn-helix transcriptional regulator [Fructobacillus tropaeoli]
MNNNTGLDLRQIIKGYRVSHSMTQKNLADSWQVPQRAISRWEQSAQSNPSIESLLHISSGLNLSIDELIEQTFVNEEEDTSNAKN